MLILAIETSCDETAAAVIKGREILSTIVFSQEKIHAKFGGIVPEVAARSHIEVIMPVIKKALSQACIKKEQLDAIAVTYGPGLITSLMVGVDTAKSLSFALNKPIIPINHLEGHIYANLIGIRNDKLSPDSIGTKFVINNEIRPDNVGTHFVTPIFPLLCLIVSGGHTELVYMPRHLKYKLIGETRDDAAGECFDKVAKLLNIGYPGGPVISRLAEKGDPRAYNFPRPMINSGDFDFSFSGLKTDVLRLVKKQRSDKLSKAKFVINNEIRPDNVGAHFVTPFSSRDLKNICASFQAAVCDVLIAKTLTAAKKYKPKTIALAGGVAANKFLREKMEQEIKTQIPNTCYLKPNTLFCTDNAAIIGACAYFKSRITKKSTWKNLQVDPNSQL